MGAYSPLGIEDRLTEQVMATVIEPAIRGMAAEGNPYEGILYAGLILTAEGPRVLEFNARFGDPETQVILPRWQDDLYQVLVAATEGKLADLPAFRWDVAATCGVVLASAGYPSEPITGLPIHGLDQQDPDTLIFHGGTRRDARTNDVCSSGGRVLTVVGKGATAEEARSAAYARADSIHFEGCWRRNDIGLVGPDAS
jgi:phosphoribosylamine--glycine ligase